MATTLVFGSGYLATGCAEGLPGAVVLGRDAPRVELTDGPAVAAALRTYRPSAVLNAAGRTGTPNVDWCEEHKAETYRSNVVGALVLAEACAAAGVPLVHLGTGCVFYGPSPHPGGAWREDDVANPVSFYSRTKYAADLVLGQLPSVAVLRIRMPLDHRPGPKNLITKLASYRRVIDVANSVTFLDDLVPVVAGLLTRRASGVFHGTNPGALRHQEILTLYRELVDPSHSWELVPETTLLADGLVARRRSTCLLADQRLAALGLAMRPVADTLRDTLTRYGALHRKSP